MLLMCTFALAATALSSGANPVSPARDGPTVGEAAPELRVEAPDGVATDWAALRGRVVVIEFWATWCGPCIPALDHLEALSKELAAEQVVFLGVSPETPERMERFLATREVSFPILLDRADATFEAYGVRVVPTTIVIDRDGNLAARTRPEKLTAAVLRRVLAGEPAGLEIVHDVASNIEWEPENSPDGEVFARLVMTPSESASGGFRFAPGSGKITGDGMHRNNMLQVAYDVPHTRMRNRLTPWAADDPVFKLFVLAPGGDDELARRMLARTLEVKFRLTAHFEELEADVLVLAWDPDVRPWPQSEAPKSAWTSSAYGGGLDFVAQPITRACEWFENIVQKPVIDETGLEGRYDLKMEWVDRAGFQDELARLGMELIPERRAVRFLVVEPGS